MATIMKVMFDDHARIKRLFGRAKRLPNDVDTAIALCQELDIHTTIMDEIVAPALEELSPDLAAQLEADHERTSELVDQIYQFDIPDPEMRPLVEQLEWLTAGQMEWEDRTVSPLLKDRLSPQEVIDMGLAAFARRQEELDGIPARRLANAEVPPNAGWGNSGHGGTVAVAGW